MADHEISKTEEKTAWERLLRRMLPLGAPLPDEEQLDYSISVDYIAPPLPSTSQTTVAQKGKLYPQSEIENFSQQVEELGLRNEDSDSNSMFSLKSFTIAGDQFDLQSHNMDSDSRFSLRSLFASTDQSGNTINKSSHLGEISRGKTETKATGTSSDVAVNASAAARKRSVCNKCRKGSKLNLRKTCIVFGARYCRSCMCS